MAPLHFRAHVRCPSPGIHVPCALQRQAIAREEAREVRAQTPPNAAGFGPQYIKPRVRAVPIADLLRGTSSAESHEMWNDSITSMGGSWSTPSLKLRPMTTHAWWAAPQVSSRDPFDIPLRERLLETTRLPSRERKEALDKVDKLAENIKFIKIPDKCRASAIGGRRVSSVVAPSLGLNSRSSGSGKLAEDVAPPWLDAWVSLQQDDDPHDVLNQRTWKPRAVSASDGCQRIKHGMKRLDLTRLDLKRPSPRHSLLGSKVDFAPCDADANVWIDPSVKRFWTVHKGLQCPTSPLLGVADR